MPESECFFHIGDLLKLKEPAWLFKLEPKLEYVEFPEGALFLLVSEPELHFQDAKRNKIFEYKFEVLAKKSGILGRFSYSGILNIFEKVGVDTP